MYLDDFNPQIIISLNTVADKFILNGREYDRTRNFEEGPAIYEGK
jgi:hypothetical protein